MALNKYKFFLFIIILLISCAFFLNKYSKKKEYNFKAIKSYEEVIPEIKCNKTLIFFDIDDTIITADDSFIQGNKYSLFFILRSLFKYPHLIFRKNWEKYFSIIWQNLDWKLTDGQISDFIDELRNRGCHVFALTAMETGSFGQIPNMPEWRFNLLNRLNIKFSGQLPNVKFQCMGRHRGNYPELYNGIISCNKQPKGKVVEALLDCFNLKPEKIIFFDDDKTNLISVADICKKRKIKFHGYIFNHDKKRWNDQLAHIKFDYLVENNIWLLDSQVAG